MLYCTLKNALMHYAKKNQNSVMTCYDLYANNQMRPATVLGFYNNTFQVISIPVLDSLCRKLNCTPGSLFTIRLPEDQKESSLAYTFKRITIQDEITCNLEKILKKKEISAYSLATKTGVRINSIYNIIQGKSQRLRRKDIESICEYLNIDFGDMYVYRKKKKQAD